MANQISTCNGTLAPSPGVIWMHCCPGDGVNPITSEDCPPILQDPLAACPGLYSNCGDPAVHQEMCVEGAVRHGGYNDTFPLQQKCCPINYSCGPTWGSACFRSSADGDSDTDAGADSDIGAGTAAPANASTAAPAALLMTNPQYLRVAGIFAGCGDATNPLTPAVVGGLVTCGILLVTVLCFVLLWLMRRHMYRAPRPRRRAGHARGRHAGGRAGGIMVTKQITVQRDCWDDAADSIRESAGAAEPVEVLQGSEMEKGDGSAREEEVEMVLLGLDTQARDGSGRVQPRW